MKAPKGFSLVELLIVIGVMVVLVALLLPAVNMVRAKSRAAQCQANQYQIGLAIQASNRAMSKSIRSSKWQETLRPYLEEEGLFTCPSHLGPIANGSYGMTHRVHRMMGSDSRKIVVADYDLPEMVSVVRSVGEQNWGAGRAARHGGQMNVLYYDGTVQSHTPDEIDPRICRYFLESWRPFRDFAIHLTDCGSLSEGLSEDPTDSSGSGTTDSGTGTTVDPSVLGEYYVTTSRGFGHPFELSPYCRVAPDPEYWEAKSGYQRAGPESYIWEFDSLDVVDWNDMILLFDPMPDGTIRVTHIWGDYNDYNVTLELYDRDDSLIKAPYEVGDVFTIDAAE